MSIVALSLALAGASAPAQSTDDVLRRFAACAAKRNEVEVRAMLDAPNEDAYRAAVSAMSLDFRCAANDEVTTTVGFASVNQNRGKLRGMVAEGLLKRSKSVGKLAALPQAKAYAGGWFLMTRRPRPVDEMAMCVASVNPGGILALLATQPGSTAQRQAFTTLTPSLGTCLAKGYQLDTKPPGLRAALAEALYHRDFYAGVPGEGAQK